MCRWACARLLLNCLHTCIVNQILKRRNVWPVLPGPLLPPPNSDLVHRDIRQFHHKLKNFEIWKKYYIKEMEHADWPWAEEEEESTERDSSAFPDLKRCAKLLDLTLSSFFIFIEQIINNEEGLMGCSIILLQKGPKDITYLAQAIV